MSARKKREEERGSKKIVEDILLILARASNSIPELNIGNGSLVACTERVLTVRATSEVEVSIRRPRDVVAFVKVILSHVCCNLDPGGAQKSAT